jgi:hypothetical protein
MSLTDYGVRGILLSMLADTPMSDQLLQLAFQFESDLPAGKSEDLSFLGAIGVLKEWGEAGRNITQPKEYDFTLRNLKFSGGVRIPNDWAENDKTGQVRDKLGDLVKRRAAVLVEAPRRADQRRRDEHQDASTASPSSRTPTRSTRRSTTC